jgi:hypothetical protein
MEHNFRLSVCDVYPHYLFFRFFPIISNHFFTVILNKYHLKKMKKILCILLAVCFVISVTAASANANPIKNTHIYQLGYNAGAKAGYKAGFDAGSQDCIKYRYKGATTKIPNSVKKACWCKDYNVGYNLGFKNNFIPGYNDGRYGCLK